MCECILYQVLPNLTTLIVATCCPPWRAGGRGGEKLISLRHATITRESNRG